MSSPTRKERKMKFNKLSNNLNIKFIQGTGNSILYMKDYINNKKKINRNLIDLGLENKQIAFCAELPFGLLSFFSYVDIEAMNVISVYVEMNEYKLLGTKLKKIVNALKLLGMPHFLGFFKQLKDEGKIKSDDIDNELSKYMELNKTRLIYMMIKKFKDSRTDLKAILNEIEKIKIIRELEIEEIKVITQKKLKKLEIEKIDELEEWHVKLRFGIIINRFFKKPNSIEDEIELKKITRKKINGVDRLETKVKEIEYLKIERKSKATKVLKV